MAKRRKVLTIPGRKRGNADLNDGVTIGNLVFSSVLTGVDMETQKIPTDPVRQAELLFQNIRAFMEAAGGSVDDIAHVTLYLREGESRKPFDDEWNKMFPDVDDRPARHRVSHPLRPERIYEVDLIAVLS